MPNHESKHLEARKNRYPGAGHYPAHHRPAHIFSYNALASRAADPN
jgi:hypothetical protein